MSRGEKTSQIETRALLCSQKLSPACKTCRSERIRAVEARKAMFVTKLMDAMGALGEGDTPADEKPKSLADTIKAAKAENENKEERTQESLLRKLNEREAIIRAELDEADRLRRELQQIITDKKAMGAEVNETIPVSTAVGRHLLAGHGLIRRCFARRDCLAAIALQQHPPLQPLQLL